MRAWTLKGHKNIKLSHQVQFRYILVNYGDYRHKELNLLIKQTLKSENDPCDSKIKQEYLSNFWQAGKQCIWIATSMVTISASCAALAMLRLSDPCFPRLSRNLAGPAATGGIVYDNSIKSGQNVLLSPGPNANTPVRSEPVLTFTEPQGQQTKPIIFALLKSNQLVESMCYSSIENEQFPCIGMQFNSN